jgi:hypothetical protein
VKGESSAGYGVEAISAGTGLYARGGNAVYGEGQASNGTGVWGVANNGSSARGVYGSSSSGTGVVGRTTDVNGTGVEAIGGGTSSSALKINNGGITVTGAGQNTSTAVFRHKVSYGYGGTPANVCDEEHATWIDNPYTNNNPDAILFVTFNPKVGPVWTSNSFGVYYNEGDEPSCPNNKWIIYERYYDDDNSSLYDLWYNVMVVNP